MNSKALICAPLLVLGFVFSDLSGMSMAAKRARAERIIKPIYEERARHQQTAAILEQERQRAAAAEQERQRIAEEHALKCQEAEQMRQKIIEEEAQLKETQCKIEEAEQTRLQIFAEKEQACRCAEVLEQQAVQERQTAEQERIDKIVDLDKFLDGIAFLKQKSRIAVQSDGFLYLTKYNTMVSRAEGSSKGIKVTTDYASGKDLNAKSNDLTEFVLCGLCDHLLDEMGLTGNIFQLYKSIPDFPDANECRRRYVFEKVDDIIKNDVFSLKSKAIYLKSYIDEAKFRNLKLSISENDYINTDAAKWFYYFLYSAVYEGGHNHIDSSESSCGCFCCGVS